MQRKTVATRRCRRLLALAAAAAAPALARDVGAEPLRLRADAVAESQSPAGLVVLQGQGAPDKARPWLDAEALVWAGARNDAAADVLVLTFRLRAPRGLGELRGGRFVFTTGSIRPVHVDGVSLLARAPWGSTVEAVAGAPVVPRFADRAYDWIVGTRAAQTLGVRATAGISYLQRRTHGELAGHEMGADVAMIPLPWLDVAARSAYDLTSPGIADALVSAAARFAPWRVEVFATHRSPSRLLPATSLFSVLGDFPSEMLGTTVKWLAAPRLDLLATAAGQAVGGELGGNAWLRAVLRLDDRGDGSLGFEARRQDVSTARWTGLRALGSHPIAGRFRFSTELELAFPDQPRGRGFAWPWGLLALAWRSGDGWEAAGGMEAASTPEHRFEVNALVRLSRTLEIR